jgi:hypothetical protein
MGERVSVDKFCDFKVKRGRKSETCGQDVPNNEATAITLGTTRYFMDLCLDHQQLMIGALEPFTSVAHNTEKRVGTQVLKAIKGRGGQTFTAADVRQWLKEQGREIAHTGRIPTDLIREFEAAHK